VDAVWLLARMRMMVVDSNADDTMHNMADLLGRFAEEVLNALAMLCQQQQQQGSPHPSPTQSHRWGTMSNGSRALQAPMWPHGSGVRERRRREGLFWGPCAGLARKTPVWAPVYSSKRRIL